MARRFLGRLHMVSIFFAYLLLSFAGFAVFFIHPSPSLLAQGGWIVLIPWGSFCILGGLCGCIGVVGKKPLFELLGAALGASASLTWAASLILQATEAGSAAITAACMAGVLALLFAQRWVGIYRRGRLQ